MECTNVAECSCTYPCPRKGKCCQCVAYHRQKGELPGCYFSKEAEAGYDRSLARYLKDRACGI